MLSLPVLAFTLGLGSYAWADQTLLEYLNLGNRLLYNGFISQNFTVNDLESSNSPYAVVKGTRDDSQYFHFLGPPNSSNSDSTPSQLWGETPEQVINVTIDTTSSASAGLFRSQLTAQNLTDNRTDFDAAMEQPLPAYHFSLRVDSENPLNYTHEYQLASIALSDGTYAFEVQTGIPSNTTQTEYNATTLRVLSHGHEVLFQTDFEQKGWHNIGVIVNSVNNTLQVFYSMGPCLLQNVTDVVDNSSVGKGSIGNLTLGLSKSPLNGTDSGQFTEGILFSGVFIEDITGSGAITVGGANEDGVCIV